MQFEPAGVAVDARQAQLLAGRERVHHERRRVEFAAEAHVGEHAARLAIGVEGEQLRRDAGAQFAPGRRRQRVARSDELPAQRSLGSGIRRYFSSHWFT